MAMWLFRSPVNLIPSQAVQLVLRVSAVVVRMVDKHRVETDMVLRERRRDWVNSGVFFLLLFFFYLPTVVALLKLYFCNV